MSVLAREREGWCGQAFAILFSSIMIQVNKINHTLCILSVYNLRCGAYADNRLMMLNPIVFCPAAFFFFLIALFMYLISDLAWVTTSC